MLRHAVEQGDQAFCCYLVWVTELSKSVRHRRCKLARNVASAVRVSPPWMHFWRLVFLQRSLQLLVVSQGQMQSLFSLFYCFMLDKSYAIINLEILRGLTVT